jgi:SAM-dependent methyltransferase
MLENEMLELITGDAVFNGMVPHYLELPLPTRMLLACIFMIGFALLVMTLISLISYVAGGAPFIATSKRLTRKIVSLAGIQPGERVYDLGCGDGRFLIEAAKSYGASAIGIEISPVVCGLAKITAWINRANVSFHCVNFKKYDFSDADVVFCYLVPNELENLGKYFYRLKKGCRILSRRFEIPGQTPAKQIKIRTGFGAETVYVYRVEGLLGGDKCIW